MHLEFIIFNKKKTKKLLKKILTDQIFQKLKLKFFLLYKTENIMLFYRIKHPSDTCRQLSFRTSSLYTKITGLSYTKQAAEGCWISDKNCKKKVVLNQDSNQGPFRDQKKWEFLSRALPLSYGRFLLKDAGFTHYSFKTIYLPKQI